CRGERISLLKSQSIDGCLEDGSQQVRGDELLGVIEKSINQEAEEVVNNVRKFLRLQFRHDSKEGCCLGLKEGVDVFGGSLINVLASLGKFAQDCRSHPQETAFPGVVEATGEFVCHFGEQWSHSCAVRNDHIAPAPTHTLTDGCEAQKVVQYGGQNREHLLPILDSGILLAWVDRRHNILNKYGDELQMIYKWVSWLAVLNEFDMLTCESQLAILVSGNIGLCHQSLNQGITINLEQPVHLLGGLAGHNVGYALCDLLLAQVGKLV
ncbi:unnamed protein product, partial [Fusarium graminearum]